MSLPIFGADSRFDNDTLTVPAAATGFPSANLLDDRIFTAYKPNAAAATIDIITDAGVAVTVDVDYFMAVGHDLFDPGGGGGGAVTLTFAHSADNISYTPIFTHVATANTIIAKKFATFNNRFFRLRLTRGTAFAPSIGQLQWGVAVETEAGLDTGFDPDEETIMARSNRSQNGNILGAINLFSERIFPVVLPLQTSGFVTGTTLGQFKDFWNNHARLLKPFLAFWNPIPVGDGDEDLFMDNAFFGIIDPSRGIRRSLPTQVSTGFRNLEFTVMGLSEQP